jgi:hypothetical protein
MIADRYSTVPPHPPGGGSGEIAAGRVLHVQRFTLPLELNSTAQRRLGRRPPLPALLANNHHPPPALDNMAQRPRSRVDPAMSNAWSRSCSNRARSASGKPARTCSAGSDNPDRSPARHRSHHGSLPPDQCSAQECDSVCSGEPACRSSPPLGTAIIERLLLPKQLGPSPTVIPPEYRPTPSSTRVTGTTLPRPGRCCTQGALLSSETDLR